MTGADSQDRAGAIEITLPPERLHECGTPVYRENPDGSVSVYFDVCPEHMTAPADAQWGMPSAGPAAVEIRHIHE